jgi:hypothetical protein
METSPAPLAYHWSWRQTAALAFKVDGAAQESTEQQDEEEEEEEVQECDTAMLGVLPVHTVTVLELESVSSADIEHRYATTPVVFRGDLSPYFGGDWSLTSLEREYGDHFFTILVRLGLTEEVHMCLSNFAHYLHCNADEKPMYLFESKIPPSLAMRIRIPEFFAVNYLTELDDPAFSGRQWLLIGGVGSGLSFHVDPFGCSAWQALLQGRKRWALYPPERVPPAVTLREGSQDCTLYDSPTSSSWFREVLPLLTEEERPIEFVQEAGDIIFVPHGWWHCVVNLTVTVAFTQNVINRANVYEACRQFRSFEPAFASRLAEKVWDLHKDEDVNEASSIADTVTVAQSEV